MDQWKKNFPRKPDNLSLISRTHINKGGRRGPTPQSGPLTFTHGSTCVHTITTIITQFKVVSYSRELCYGVWECSVCVCVICVCDVYMYVQICVPYVLMEARGNVIWPSLSQTTSFSWYSASPWTWWPASFSHPPVSGPHSSKLTGICGTCKHRIWTRGLIIANLLSH